MVDDGREQPGGSIRDTSADLCNYPTRGRAAIRIVSCDHRGCDCVIPVGHQFQYRHDKRRIEQLGRRRLGRREFGKCARLCRAVMFALGGVPQVRVLADQLVRWFTCQRSAMLRDGQDNVLVRATIAVQLP